MPGRNEVLFGGGSVVPGIVSSMVLLHKALRMPYRFERGKLRPWVYYCLFGLLSVSGLRPRRSA